MFLRNVKLKRWIDPLVKMSRDLQTQKSSFKILNCFRGKVLVPLRLTRPWLLLDWIYRMTDNAAAEVNQKARLNDFTKKV